MYQIVFLFINNIFYFIKEQFKISILLFMIFYTHIFYIIIIIIVHDYFFKIN